MSICVRASVMGDVPLLVLQQKAAFALPLTEKDLTAYTDNPLYMMKTVTYNGTPAGHCLVSIIGSVAELISITVDSKYRGIGCGKALLKAAMKAAAENGCDEMLLEVRISNSKAISLYRSMNFTSIATRKDFYERPTEDGYTMRAALKG